ncbi:MAG: type I-E CRISPR-associated endoribonuclease Cas2 [Chlorobi bacterium]|nr:type I-E CRISPR-associated endoribonuclease Cas2 [Chlorobiota bacterium]
MTIYSLERSPQKLRGMLSRYCLEVRAGLFVGRLDARMRELLWEKVEQLATEKTSAVMIWRAMNEQGYEFRTFGSDRRMPVLVDGIWLVQKQPSKTKVGHSTDHGNEATEK